MKFQDLLAIIIISVFQFSSVPNAHALEKRCDYTSLRKMELSDFVFSFDENNELSVTPENKEKFKKINITLNVIENNTVNLSGEISLSGSDNTVCKKLEFSVSPILLCKGVDLKIEPWTIIPGSTIPEDRYSQSIVSKYADVGDDVVIKGSRICGFSELKGNILLNYATILSKANSQDFAAKIIDTELEGQIWINESVLEGDFDISNSNQDIYLDSLITKGRFRISIPIYIYDLHLEGNLVITCRNCDEYLKVIQRTQFYTEETEESEIDFTGFDCLANSRFDQVIKLSTEVSNRIYFDNARFRGKLLFSNAVPAHFRLENVDFGGDAIFDFLNKEEGYALIKNIVLHEEFSFRGKQLWLNDVEANAPLSFNNSCPDTGEYGGEYFSVNVSFLKFDEGNNFSGSIAIRGSNITKPYLNIANTLIYPNCNTVARFYPYSDLSRVTISNTNAFDVTAFVGEDVSFTGNVYIQSAGDSISHISDGSIFFGHVITTTGCDFSGSYGPNFDCEHPLRRSSFW